jgi:hydrogenase maturation protein HypF
MIQRAKATITGVVQGVGFRPFVYGLALKNGLGGYIANTTAGVDIEVEGEPRQIESFFDALEIQRPPLAKVTHIERRYLPPVLYKDFAIRASRTEGERSALLSPDVCVCEDCLREMNDPKDRRYRYPFINCTNCGPRYTIIQEIPYDRKNTVMASFTMCEQCRREYEDPLNRRYHAQPVACWACGPNVFLHGVSARPLEGFEAISATADLLKAGRVVAIKGLGGFHLAVDATQEGAVARLRERKYREEKPLALMSLGIPDITRYAHVSEAEMRALQSSERPIVLLQKKEPSVLSSEVAPRNGCFGVMLPYTPLHYLLLQQGFLALVLTSGNVSDEPIAVDNEEAFRRLSGIADYFLTHNRDIYVRNDDSVVRVIGGKARMIRRSRGYAPLPVPLKRAIRPTLACGPFLANTISVGKGKEVFLSQHVGDLETWETDEVFRKTIEHLKRIFEVDPEVIAYDLHPDYLSTQYATGQQGVWKVGVQHHHAHIASCMAENGVSGTVIGLAMDGTGYGTDGTVWGGEILVADLHGFERIGHLEQVPLPGGEAAVREPWRMGVVYLYKAFGPSFMDRPLPFVRNLDRTRAGLVVTMIEKNLNSPQTSSCGRLFDGVAALLGLRSRVSYRAQAAMELEMERGDGDCSPCADPWCEVEKKLIIPQTAIVRGVVSDLLAGVDRPTISQRFHHTLVRVFADVCAEVRRRRSLSRVVLSGGVFQNGFLLGELEKTLLRLDFEVYTHGLVPTNDGGISLGQAVVANAILDRQT